MNKIERVEVLGDILNCSRLIDKFIVEAGEFERTLSSILHQIMDVLNKKGAMWVIKNEDVPIGYLFAQVIRSEFERDVCLIHEFFIEKKYSSRALIKNMESILSHWASQNGANELYFFTRRSAKAFTRFLKDGWEIDSVVIKRKNEILQTKKNEEVNV